MKTEHVEFIQSIASILVRRYYFNPDVANFIGCQFALESSYGTSYIASKFNNFTGMKTPLVRISVALNAGLSTERDYHAKYYNFEDCVLDYVLCLQYYHPLRCELEQLAYFKKFIKKFYCPDKSYIDKIDSIYVQFNQTLKTLSNANTK